MFGLTLARRVKLDDDVPEVGGCVCTCEVILLRCKGWCPAGSAVSGA